MSSEPFPPLELFLALRSFDLDGLPLPLPIVFVIPLRRSERGGKGMFWKREEEEGSYGAALTPFLRLAMVIVNADVNVRSVCRTTRVSYTPSEDVNQLEIRG